MTSRQSCHYSGVDDIVDEVLCATMLDLPALTIFSLQRSAQLSAELDDAYEVSLRKECHHIIV
jgi:hypothetical protein